MIGKQELLDCAIENFTQFGTRSFTLQQLANLIGISKKTIYQYFASKEELVAESVQVLLENYQQQIDDICKTQADPINAIIEIYQKGFEIIRNFKPSFIYGIKKYYPLANTHFEEFRLQFTFQTIYDLLAQAQQTGLLRKEVKLKLSCILFFNQIEHIVFKNDNLFDIYTKQDILYHLIISNLRGLAVSNYNSPYFDRSFLDQQTC